LSKKSCHFPSSCVASHASFLLLINLTIFFIIDGFFRFCGCTVLEDCALAIFLLCFRGLVVFCDALAIFLLCFGGWWFFLRCFGALVLWWVFLLLMASPPLFFLFLGDLGGMSLSCRELAPPELNNDSCVDGERGDIEDREDGSEMTKTDGRVSSTWKKMICPRSLDI
jgi:hypothetical protein